MPTETMPGSANGTSMSRDEGPERLQEAASGILDQASRTATTQASRTVSRAGETLEQVARVVRDSGNQLRDERPEVAEIAETVAQRVEQASSYLRQHDAQQLLNDAERIARRQPALVVGGGLLAGLLLGRLLRSGAEPDTNGSAGRQGAMSASSDWSTAASASSMPSGGYGTGYGATYDSPRAGMSDDGDSLATTDSMAGGGATGPSGSADSTTRSTKSSRSSTGSSTTRRRTPATGTE
jgi:ElaB/YqjD/DUF883 family membrane-anchored ribosome-binding protein